MAGADNVSRGWAAVVERGGQFDFPDSGTTDLASAARGRLLLAPSDLGDVLAEGVVSTRPGVVSGLVGRLRGAAGAKRFETPDCSEVEVLAALAESGHLDPVRRSMPTLADAVLVGSLDRLPPEALGRFVEAISRAFVFACVREPAELALEPLARATKHLEGLSERSDPTDWMTAAEGLTALADFLGEHDAALDLRARLAEASTVNDGSRLHDQLTALAQRAHSSGRWLVAAESSGSAAEPVDQPSPDSLLDAARFWRLARLTMVRELMQASTPTIELLPGFPAAWRGGPVEVHEAPTLYGTLSFAIRWHGARPALLWDQGEGSAILVCPALDPDWSTNEAKGETLLAGTSEGLVDVPAPGDSFS